MSNLLSHTAFEALDVPKLRINYENAQARAPIIISKPVRQPNNFWPLALLVIRAKCCQNDPLASTALQRILNILF